MVEQQFQSRRPATSLVRWLFPMMALGGLSTSLGPIGKWVGLTIFVPLLGGLWWRERARSKERRELWRRADFEVLDIDEFRTGYDGFYLLNKEETRREIRWGQIRGIAAYIDFQAHGDVLTIGLRLDDVPGWIGIPGDIEGFPQLRLALHERYGIPHGWAEAVWQGPRGLNWRGLWGDARPPGDVCWKCEYDLRGNESGACPECGMSFVWPTSGIASRPF